MPCAVGNMQLVLEDATIICQQDAFAEAEALSQPPGSADVRNSSWTGFRLTEGAIRAVVVTNSSSLAAALLDGRIDTITIADAYNQVPDGLCGLAFSVSEEGIAGYGLVV